MNWDTALCEDNELIKVSDRLNRCKESKTMLDLELCNEEFKLKYIHKRRKLTASKSRTRMMYIIPYTLVVIGCIYILIYSVIDIKREYNIASMICMLVSLLGLIFCGYISVRLWIPEIKMLGKLNPFGKNRDEERGVVTFEVERQKSEEKISVLQAQIETVNKEIAQLSSKKRERELFIRSQLLEKKANSLLGNDGGAEDTKNAGSGLGSFALKKDEVTGVQAEEMLRICEKEIKKLEGEQYRLEREYKEIQDKIIDIDLGIIDVRDKVISYVLVGIILTIIVSLFKGVVMHILGAVWCVIMLPYMLWLIKECKEPVVSYLVEHDNKQIRDYAFTHSITPLYKKRQEIAKEITYCSKDLHRMQSKKQEIENLGLL
ncbi:MAG: hypothetical protein E7263_09090 [Lachnospiraceae bacterium]|nr:hypothetical protein [Lachnospiraceae bacterium]